MNKLVVYLSEQALRKLAGAYPGLIHFDYHRRCGVVDDGRGNKACIDFMVYSKTLPTGYDQTEFIAGEGFAFAVGDKTPAGYVPFNPCDGVGAGEAAKHCPQAETKPGSSHATGSRPWLSERVEKKERKNRKWTN